MKLNKRIVFSIYRYYLLFFAILMTITATSICLFPMNIFVKILISSVSFGFLCGICLLLLRQIKRNPIIIIFLTGIFVFVIGYFLTYNPSVFKRDKSTIEYKYCSYVKKWQGTPYKKNGESKYGIDSNGIAKSSMWQSMLKYSLKNSDWELLFHKCPVFWWRDLSDQDIVNGKYNYTYQKGTYVSLYDIPEENLDNGDMIYIQRHELLLIYIGNNECIYSNKTAGVTKLNLHNKDIKLRNSPVILIGWNLFKK